MSEFIAPPPPPHSNITVEDDGQVFKIIVPPDKRLQGGWGWVRFEVIWPIILAILTLFFIAQNVWKVMPAMGILWAHELFMLYHKKKTNQERAIFAVSNKVLLIVGFKSDGQFEVEFPQDQISDISAKRSEASGPGSDVMELQIRPLRGEILKLFTGRDIEELDWIAFRLNIALEI